jgi:hypothetical protein
MPLLFTPPASAATVPFGVATSEVMDLFSSTTPRSVTATTDGVAHTMGAWVEVVASTSADIDGFYIGLYPTPNNSNTADTTTLVDVGIGAAASETVIAAGIEFGYQAQTVALPGACSHPIPVHIPAGSRIAVRAQSARTAQAVTVAFFGALQAAAGVTCPSALVSYGVVSASSSGTVLTAPGSLNTKGAWLEIEDSTGVALQAIVVIAGPGTGGSLQATCGLLVDVAVGASSSEVVVAANITAQTTNTESAGRNANGSLFAVAIPAGSRLAARYQRSVAAQACSVAILGVPA